MADPETRNIRRAGIAEVEASWSSISQALAWWTDRNQFARSLICLEGVVLMGGAVGPLLIAHLTIKDTGAMSVQVLRWAYEYLVLGLLVLFWCGWCEGGYRLGLQMGSFEKVPWHRRMTLELWSGVLLSLLLSVLTSLSALLSLVAAFLLFGGIEALKASGSGQTLWASLLRGSLESFRTFSLAPRLLLTRLAIPGFLLYLTTVLLKISQIHYRDFLLSTSPALPNPKSYALAVLIVVLGLIQICYFFLARMDLIANYLVIEHARQSHPPPLVEKTLNRMRSLGSALASVALVVFLFFVFYELFSSGLFGRSFIYMTLEALVGIVNGFVQSLIDLFAKFTFIVIIFILIIGLCLFLTALAKGNVNGILGRSISSIAGRVKRLSEFINSQINLPGQAIQITTLLSAVGLIATQTYTRIVEAQNLREEQQKLQEQQVNLHQQRMLSYGDHAEDQISQFQKDLQTLMGSVRSESDWLDLDRRAQVASLTRDLTRQLQDPDGYADGKRRARVLKYLYDSRFLIQNESPIFDGRSCDALTELLGELPKQSGQFVTSQDPRGGVGTRTVSRLPQIVLDRQLTDEVRNHPKKNCKLPRLVPLNMDFSHADLPDAMLINAALPFINLSHADLGNASLRNADLRFANLKNANLRGADLRGARLDHANLVNAELSSAKLEGTSFKGAITFYSSSDSDKLIHSLSWRLSPKTQVSWCPLDYRKDKEGEIQADAKCANRTYSGYKRKDSLIEKRNWASGDFKGTTIENFRLNGIKFTNADLSGAVFKYVHLMDVDFTGAKLDGTRFEDSVLSNVDFTGAIIPHMVFKGSSVERLTFRGSQYVLPIQLGDYADDLLLASGRNMDLSPSSNQSPPAKLAQRLLLPLLLSPFPLRPSRVLIWLIPYSPEILFATESRQSIP